MVVLSTALRAKAVFTLRAQARCPSKVLAGHFAVNTPGFGRGAGTRMGVRDLARPCTRELMSALGNCVLTFSVSSEEIYCFVRRNKTIIIKKHVTVICQVPKVGTQHHFKPLPRH